MNYYGYDWEAHEVTTEDGYNVKMFHITGKRGYEWYESTRPEIPVLIMHGATMDASTWFSLFMMPPPDNENAPLPAALFDNGFDVWIGSSRGTQYSMPEDLDPNDSTYWDFTVGGLSNDAKAFVTEILS